MKIILNHNKRVTFQSTHSRYQSICYPDQQFHVKMQNSSGSMFYTAFFFLVQMGFEIRIIRYCEFENMNEKVKFQKALMVILWLI